MGEAPALTRHGRYANHAPQRSVGEMSDSLDRLEAAERRLDDALARFETALASAAGRPSAAAQGSLLKAECAKLQSALDEAKRRNVDLQEMSRDAAARLDDAIAQIDLLLEG